MKKLSIVLILMLGVLLFKTESNAQLINQNFETGNLGGWLLDGGGYASTGETYQAWVILPSGAYMGFQFPEFTINISGAETNLGLSAGSLSAHNFIAFDQATDFSTMHQDIIMAAGQTIIMYWNYVSTDYAPFNDGCFSSFVGPSHQEIHVLAMTTDAGGEAGAIVVGTYGSSGWHSRSFTAPTAGTYRIGFGGFNKYDQVLDPWTFMDDGPGGTAAPGNPIVTTDVITNIAPPSATGGGSVSPNGFTPAIDARGICWNTTGDPTLADSFTTDGSGFGNFSSNLTGLVSGQTYFVRAYATNSEGTFYGPQVSFSTGGPVETPISNWALILGGIAMITFVALRFKRVI